MKYGRHIAVSIVLLLNVVVPPVAAQSNGQAELGRFFTTPRTRAELDNARENYAADIPRKADRPAGQGRALQQLELSGVVLRSDGAGQAWINNSTNIEQTGAIQSISIYGSNQSRPRAAVTLPDGSRIELRPGESFSLETGRIRDSFQKEGVKPRENSQPGDASDDQKVEPTEEVEQFDEAELADRDTRILLLEKRLEKLESTIEGPDQQGRDGPPESKEN